MQKPTPHSLVIYDAQQQVWLHFREPITILEATRLEQVIPQLQEVNDRVQKEGLYGAGLISYEAATAFDPALTTHHSDLQPDAFPLLWFGLYSPPERVHWPEHNKSLLTELLWTPTLSFADYQQAIDQIKAAIARGETYQVNYTLRLHTPFDDDPWPFFQQLLSAQQADYGAYADLGRFVVCSASPELFFRLDQQSIISRPMKGTAARGSTPAADRQQAEWLRHSCKNQAENLMIVDMIRNDLGRIAQLKSVEVPALFAVEQYPTLWQMTSTVIAKTEASISQIFAALFPCASITGAPKARTMQIIRNLEATPRRIYTGTIGFMTPHQQAQFNVAIRTVLVDRVTAQAEYGVGGGIVWDSIAAEEYQECQIKTQILTAKYLPPAAGQGPADSSACFQLLETLLWSYPTGYFLLDEHLQRLQQAAGYFGFALSLADARHCLMDLTVGWSQGDYKVRLLVSRDGTIQCQAQPLVIPNTLPSLRLGICPYPIDRCDAFLYYKTTQRQVYEQARAACPDCDDVLLWNQQQEVTETCFGNLVIEIDGERITPPVTCGLLAGTFRASLLVQGKIREGILTLADLNGCDRIYVINSVRKWQIAQLQALSPLATLNVEENR